MLAELDRGLPARVAILEALCLVAAVVHATAEAKLVEHLRRDAQAQPPQRGDGQPRSPGRQDRRIGLSEQVRDLAERQHAVRGDVVDARQRVLGRVLERVDDVVLVNELIAGVEAQDHRDGRQREEPDVGGPDVRAEHVGEPQHRHRHVGVLLGELVHRRLGLARWACVAGGAGPSARRRRPDRPARSRRSGPRT